MIVRPGEGLALWVEHDAGAGRPLLLVSGLGMHLGHWPRSFLRALGDRSVVGYEHRGVNRSGDAGPAFTTAELAEDAALLLDGLGIATCDVLGFSLGGMVAQELALGRPDLVDRIVLVSSSPGGTAGAIEPSSWDRLWGALRGGDVERAVATSWALNSSGLDADAALAAAWRTATLSGRVRPGVVRRQQAATSAHDATGRLGPLGARTLVLHGRRDAVIPGDRGEALAAELGGEVRWLDRLGHACFWQEPERVGALVREHLERR